MPATRRTYRLDGDDAGTLVAEIFAAISIPRLIAFVERRLIRNRQAQLEAGMTQTLNAIKDAAGRATRSGH